MNKTFGLVVIGYLLASSLHGQVQVPAQGLASYLPGQQPTPQLPTFDLDFPGGNPEILIEHINLKLTESPVNVIIPGESNNIEIPAMKLKNVTVQQVFEALGRASQKMVAYPTGFADYGGVPFANRVQNLQTFTTSYTFQTTPPITTNSVWYFVVQKPPQSEEPKICRFYQLGPYMEQGLNINDITTAIKAGYKMLGEAAPPELNFHQETQLLIAVGGASKLSLIEEVLRQLPRPKVPEVDKTPRPKT